jgi:hypothetical protein
VVISFPLHFRSVKPGAISEDAGIICGDGADAAVRAGESVILL